MKIVRIAVHQVLLASWEVETRYTQGSARDIPVETNVIRIDTDTGLTGWGESCPAPSYYYPTLSAGSRVAIEHVAPLLLGEDPININARMSEIAAYMSGQKPAKAAIDMALWMRRTTLPASPVSPKHYGPVSDAGSTSTGAGPLIRRCRSYRRSLISPR